MGLFWSASVREEARRSTAPAGGENSSGSRFRRNGDGHRSLKPKQAHGRLPRRRIAPQAVGSLKRGRQPQKPSQPRATGTSVRVDRKGHRDGATRVLQRRRASGISHRRSGWTENRLMGHCTGNGNAAMPASVVSVESRVNQHWSSRTQPAGAKAGGRRNSCRCPGPAIQNSMRAFGYARQNQAYST